MPGLAPSEMRLWLAGRRKRPCGLRVQCGLRRWRGRCIRCFGRYLFYWSSFLGLYLFCWRCLFSRHSLLGFNFLGWHCFFSRDSFFGFYLLGWRCFFSRYSFFGLYLLGWHCFFSRYNFLGLYLLGGRCFFSRYSFLGFYFRCWGSLFHWCDFFWGCFFCSCHRFLLDQFTKSTSCGLECKKRCMLLGTIPATWTRCHTRPPLSIQW